MTPIELLRRRAQALPLHGLLAHWQELADCAWVEPLISWEETERARRSLERRLASAPIASSLWPISIGTGQNSVIGRPSVN